MAATMKDIARVTGLSLATISKHLNGGKVLEENKIKIDKAIKELDFHVNEFARGLKTNKSKTIGVLVKDFQTFYGSSIARHAQMLLAEKGYTTILMDAQMDSTTEKDAFLKLVSRRVDGVLSIPIDPDNFDASVASNVDVPVVFIDEVVKQHSYDAVLLNHYKAFYNATTYLIEQGHTKIAIISAIDGVRTLENQVKGYRDAMKDHGIELREEYHYNEEMLIMLTGYNGIKKLLALPDPPTAIISLRSELTLGAYIALTELKVDMPKDLSFIGVDLLDLNLISTIELTEIVTPVRNIVTSALDILLSKAESKSVPEMRHSIDCDCRFSIGKSTGPVPKEPKRYF